MYLTLAPGSRARMDLAAAKAAVPPPISRKGTWLGTLSWGTSSPSEAESNRTHWMNLLEVSDNSLPLLKKNHLALVSILHIKLAKHRTYINLNNLHSILMGEEKQVSLSFHKWQIRRMISPMSFIHQFWTGTRTWLKYLVTSKTFRKYTSVGFCPSHQFPRDHQENIKLSFTFH